jgi:hypothetical protein
VSALTFGNGLGLSQTFNQRYEPQTISSGPLELGYGMSPAGDVASLSDGATSRSFRHDFMDRLAESPGWLAYGYDGNGNRTSETVEGAQASYRYLTGDQVAWRTAGNYVDLRFFHDGQGSVAGLVRYDQSGNWLAGVCFRHDPLGRLAFAGALKSWLSTCPSDSAVASVTARYKYDSRNRRVARQVGGTWTYVISDPRGNPLSELVRTADLQRPWAKVRDYLWLDGTRTDTVPDMFKAWPWSSTGSPIKRYGTLFVVNCGP